MDEEHVGDPDLLHQTAVKGHALVVGAGEGQPLILPVVTQIKRHGEVLERERNTEFSQTITKKLNKL